MLMQAEFQDRCRARGLDEAAIERALETVRTFERSVPRGSSLPGLRLAELDAAIASMIGQLDEGALMALARYFAVIGHDDASIRLLAYLLPVGVLEAMGERLGSLEGDDRARRVMSRLSIPPVGSPPEAYPAATARFVSALLDELGAGPATRVLAWNVHGIPVSAFAAERDRLRSLGSIDAWLRDYHDRQVAELARHAADGTLWFEQRITPEVVEFVRANQEIQGGVRVGDRIFVTKIPYDPDRFLRSGDALERRRLACHCPLAASSITAAGAGVDAAWCACSAGFTKFMFDVAFGEETEAEVLSSVLAGDPLCRFAIRVPASYAGE